MSASTADALILDDEDFTPLALKDRARALTPALLKRWRDTDITTAVRINTLDVQGLTDLEAAIPAKPDFVLYPMASNADEMAALDKEISRLQKHAGLPTGCIGIVPVRETALGVADVRLIVKGSERIIKALLGAEDLAADLQAERSRDGYELDYARRRFVFECRAAGIKPIDTPYTFADVEGLTDEARNSKGLDYKSKSRFRPGNTPRRSTLSCRRRPT